MTKVILEGFIIVPEPDIDEVKRELHTHIKLTLSEKGCLTFKVAPDQSDRTKFWVYEEFVDQAAFDKHQQRVKSSRWGEVTKNVARHYNIINKA